MGTWTTRTSVETDPERVLELLTDPAACERWSPVPFELEGLEERRLAAGAKLRLGGRIAGRSVGFDVHIPEAAAQRLQLEASGPFQIAAEYEARPGGAGGTELHASVSVSGGGLKGRLMSRAAEALLRAGALDATLARIASEAKLVSAGAAA
jgi:hypothetical protein